MTSHPADIRALPETSRFVELMSRVFGGTPRRVVIALHAPFALTFLSISVVLSAFATELFLQPAFLAGFTVAVSATLITILAPWKDSRSWLLLGVGVLDIVAIGICRAATNMELGVFGLLTIFPAMMLAAQYLWRGVAVGTLGAMAVLLVPELLSDQPFDLRFWLRVLLLPWIVFMLGCTVAGFTELSGRQSARLGAEQERLARSLAASRSASLLLETILNTVDIGLYSLDSSGNPVLANRKFRDLARLMAAPDVDPRDATAAWCAQEAGALMFEMDGTTPLPPDQRPTHLASRHQTVTDRKLWLGDDPLTRRAVSVTSHEILDHDDQSQGTIVAVHDITDMVLAMRTKDDFVATVSHELRTPLTSIIGYLDLVADGVEDDEYEVPEEVQAHLAVVSRNAEQLLVLVSDLLLTAQAESGTLRFRMSDVRVDQLAARAIDSSRPRAEAAEVTLKQNIEATLPQHADHARISQVIDNLLSNAIKYTKPGGSVRVVVSATPDATVLTISDTGIGMDPHDLGSLFQKFFRADSARSNAIPGVGLGLVITKAIVDGHQGSIDVKSVLGVGSTVTVTLPRF